MSLRNDMVLRRVLAVPWSLVLTCAPVAYVLVAYVLPAAAGASPFRPILERLGRQFALVTTGAIVLIALLLAFSQRRGRRLLDQQTGLDSIRRLTWLEFERLVGGAYRRQGYSVIPTGGPGADGGVDLVLSKDGGKFLVQCKQWKANRVGVEEIRELFGVVKAERAKGGILVTSGRFTEEAMAFAAGKPLQLVAGGDFLELVRLAQPAQSPPAFSASAHVAPTSATERVAAAPACPKCGGRMVLRTARQGGSTGSRFWGCSNFPRCRATLNE